VIGRSIDMMKQIPTTIKNKDLVEKRRGQIVLAAIKLFSQKGFHKTTLRELAEIIDNFMYWLSVRSERG